MVEYKLVKYCRTCKARFVVHKSESKRYFCDGCQTAINKQKVDTEE